MQARIRNSLSFFTDFKLLRTQKRSVVIMPSYLCDSNQHIQEYENCPVFLERYLEYLQTNRDKRPLTISEAMLVLREFCQFVHYRNLYDTTPSPRDAHKHLVIIEMKPSEMARYSKVRLRSMYSSLMRKRTIRHLRSERSSVSCIRSMPILF